MSYFLVFLILLPDLKHRGGTDCLYTAFLGEAEAVPTSPDCWIQTPLTGTLQNQPLSPPAAFARLLLVPVCVEQFLISCNPDQCQFPTADKPEMLWHQGRHTNTAAPRAPAATLTQ